MTSLPEPDLRLVDDCLLAGSTRLPLSRGCADLVRRLLRQPNAVVAVDGAGPDPAGLQDELNRLNIELQQAAPGRWFVAHLPGQGLMLVSAVDTPAADRPMATAHTLPDLPARFVGRDEQLRTLEAALHAHRFVSIVGPGGHGKTTLAVALSRRLAATLADGVCFVDLARLSSGDRVGAELATALGLEAAAPGYDFAPLETHLRDRRLLIVLDSCETVVDAAAQLAEDIVSQLPHALLLVTTREPLQATGEWVHQLAPLTSPPEHSGLPAWLALTYPAVQLFCRIAQDLQAPVTVNDENLTLIAGICRRLEGSPLAIALAASHVPRLGLQGIHEQVGRRMLTLPAIAYAPGRHRTLEAVLDWSYRLLQDDERAALRSLACFRGSFDLETGASVVGAGATSTVLDLVAKSLLMPLQVGDAVRYRMPDMTREFAEAQLQRADRREYQAARRRHVKCLMDVLGAAEQQWNAMARPDWRRAYSVWIEDVRHALGWAFSDEQEILAALELTTAAFPLAEQTALFADYASFAGRAIREVSRLQPPRPDLAVKLHMIPCVSQHRWLSDDPGQFDTLVKSIEIGRSVGTAGAQLGALLSVWSHHFQVGDYAASLPWNATMQRLADAHADEVVALTARRTRAQSLHFLGQHDTARTLAQAICRQPATRIPLSYTPSPVSMGVSARIVLARIQWLEGHAGQAWRTVDDCFDLTHHDAPQSQCQVLGVAAIPLAFWCGRRDACRAWTAELLDLASRFHYAYWHTWATLFQAVLDNPGRPLPNAALDALRAVQQTKFRDHAGTFDEAHIADDALARVESGTVGWCAPEVIRVHAERALQAGDLAGASASLARALALAKSQGALAWELRAAMTAVRLSNAAGDPAGGRALLRAVYDRFDDGFDTRDLQAARHLLDG